MKRELLEQGLRDTFAGFREGDLPSGVKMTTGKVRDIFDLGEELLIVTTDRISAFDRVLTTIPFKGQVLNGMTNYWFGETSQIVPNHIIRELTPRSVVVSRCEVLPVEVVVRGYLTGSAWRDYQSGRAVSGIPLPAGMRADQRFEKPLLTPSTKAERGDHDEPISAEQIIMRRVVEPGLWSEVERIAFELFDYGTRLAADRGLILVDTKYEFGLREGKIVLVDEVHTPDSSRYWFADTYRELFETGGDQRKVDKEYLRQWLMEHEFMGDGVAPQIPDEIRVNVAERYIQSFELITGTIFKPEVSTLESERNAILSYIS